MKILRPKDCCVRRGGSTWLQLDGGTCGFLIAWKGVGEYINLEYLAVTDLLEHSSKTPLKIGWVSDGSLLETEANQTGSSGH